jgi:hypothetical protein
MATVRRLAPDFRGRFDSIPDVGYTIVRRRGKFCSGN